MDRRLTELAEEYRSGEIDRRVFLERLIVVLGSYPLAHHWLETSGWAMSLLSQAESANMNVDAAMVKYPGEGATLEGYFTHPKGSGPFPAVILIHENRGLNEHTRDVARRLAAEGFATLAVDQLSRQGGTASFATPDDANAAFRNVTDDQVVKDLDAAYDYLQSQPVVRRDRIGVMGFCWGGQRSFLYATHNANLRAAVVFYGSAPPEERMRDITAPILGNYGETDERITSQVPAVAEKLKQLGKSYDYKIYPGAPHAFFNDTGDRYNEAAAKDAWPRTLQFLKQHLS
ncbi:MAG: dienelactone hydrolase family protein [Acidobacteria bacterium]|nr:dienelactone hydrolase family protein [Acidobacteriota bacterium]